MYFNNFINSASEKSTSDIAYDIEQMIKSASPERFLQKATLNEIPLTWATINNLSESICLKSNLFPHSSYTLNLFGYESILIEAVKYVIEIIKIPFEVKDAFPLVKNLIEKSANFDFAYQLFNYLDGFRLQDTELFTCNQQKDLGTQLIIRAINNLENISFFKGLPSIQALNIFILYHKIDKKSAIGYIEKAITADAKESVDVIKMFTPIRGNLTDTAEIFTLNFRKDQFYELKNMLGETINILYTKAQDAFPNLSSGSVQFYDDITESLGDDNLLMQFLYWYEEDINSPKIKSPQ